jgi:hypothetical protein
LRAKERAARRARAAGARGLEPSRGQQEKPPLGADGAGRMRGGERRSGRGEAFGEGLFFFSISCQSDVLAPSRWRSARRRTICLSSRELCRGCCVSFCGGTLIRKRRKTFKLRELERKIVSAGDRERQPCKKQPIAICRARARHSERARPLPQSSQLKIAFIILGAERPPAPSSPRLPPPPPPHSVSASADTSSEPSRLR